MPKIIDLLNNLGFSNHEASIYKVLLENPGLTVFQLSKELSLSRSSVYPIVKNMYSNGFLVLQNGVKDHYYAIDPNSLLTQIENKMNKSILDVRPLLQSLSEGEKNNNYINLLNYDAILSKVENMMLAAKQEIVMNTDLDLNLFSETIKKLVRRHVRIIVFSFKKQNEIAGVEIYSHNFTMQSGNRIMMVVDVEQVLVANNNSIRNDWIGTYTNNSFMTKIIYEHIHHDIYLYRIKEKLGVNMFEMHPDILLNTLNEKGDSCDSDSLKK